MPLMITSARVMGPRLLLSSAVSMTSCLFHFFHLSTVKQMGRSKAPGFTLFPFSSSNYRDTKLEGNGFPDAQLCEGQFLLGSGVEGG